MRITILLLAFICSNLSAQNIGTARDFTLEFPDEMDTVTVQGVFAVMTPKDGRGDDFSENLNIITLDISSLGDIKLEDLVDLNLAQIKQMDVKVPERTTLKFGKKGLHALTTNYKSDKLSPGQMLHVWQAYITNKSTFYVVTYTAKDSTYDKYYDAMMKIVSTIDFK